MVQDFGGGGDAYYRNGQGSPGAQLQIERTNATLGTDIYDAACWQVALGLAASRGLTGVSGDKSVQSCQQYNPTRGAVCQSHPGEHKQLSIRLLCDHLRREQSLRFATGRKRIFGPRTRYGKLSIRGTLPFLPLVFDTIVARLLGQIGNRSQVKMPGPSFWAPYSLIVGNSSRRDTFRSSPNQFRMRSTYCGHSIMQSAIGAFYYAPGGCEGNSGEPVPVGEISVENCASSLAGLTILKQVLETTLGQDPSLSAVAQAKLKAGIDIICIMIWGGHCPLWSNGGMLSFFKNCAWNASKGVFYQGGVYAETAWTPTEEPQAVDVNTWGLTVLGPQTLDQWFGAGTAFNIWQNVKPWGGFSQSGQLWGVGYSDRDNNSVMSAEWTAGAVNALRCLMVYYQNDANKFSSLLADHDSMMTYLLNLRTDRYVGAGFPKWAGQPKSFSYVKPPFRATGVSLCQPAL